MFGPRRGPTLIGITQEDIDMVTARLLESTAAEEPTTAATAEAPLPVSPTNLEPASPDNDTVDTADALSVTSSELATQLPYEHLPYGREREEIVIQNHQITHLEEMDKQFNNQRAITNAAIAVISTDHQEKIKQLEEEIRSNRLAIQVLNWHLEVLTALAYPDQATDLQAERYADLRQPEIRRLREVGPAEARDEKAMKVEMNPPISTVLGIEGQGYLGGASAGQIYGAEEDLAVLLAGEREGGSEGDARAGTASVSSGEGEEEGPAGGEERAAASGHE